MARRGPFLLFNVSQPTGAPVKHVIITIGENRSFDHISATPNGTPAPGQVLHSNRRPAAVGRGLCLDFVAKVEKSEGTKTPITTSKGSHIIAGLLRKCQCRCIRRPIGDRRISATFGLWFSEVATQVCGAPARASPRSNRCHTRVDRNPPDTRTACRAARRRGPFSQLCVSWRSIIMPSLRRRLLILTESGDDAIARRDPHNQKLR